MTVVQRAKLLLPEGTRLVHIGPPKTGTTAVQGAFHARRREVLAQGVRYAGRSRHSGAAVLAVGGRPSFQRDSGPPPMRRWNDLAGEVRRSTEARVLLSSEFFADVEADRIPRIADDLGRERLHVVVTLRPLSRLLASQWQQYVQSFMRLSYDDWLDAVLNGPPGKVTPTFWRRHRHDELIERWAAVVGPERMSVVVIDEDDHDQVLRVFEQLLGLRAGTLVAEDDVTNRSMTLAEIEAVRAFNNAFWDAGLRNALYHRVMHFGAAAYMKQRQPKPGEPRIETPQWALDRSGEIAREMVARIAPSGVRIIGDLEALTVVPASGLSGDRKPGVCIPPDISAAMATGIAVVSGAARGDARVNTLVEAGGAIGLDAIPRASGAEPPGLHRFGAYPLAGSIGMRLASGMLRRVDRLIGRGWSNGPQAAGPTPPQVDVAVEAFDRWTASAELPQATRERLRSGALAGRRWAKLSIDGDETCIDPSVAASLALGVLVESGLALEAKDGRLRAARLAWSEPPELAVVPSPILAGVVVSRLLRDIARRLTNR
ncbi:MAG: hypothetical protein E6I65_02300 [Chloroflexi bacterium]|nr:MAG: hypothetical protein E6J52_08625 [Chloroflexota bacterium]TME12934.1 MAG: hypothetical protein E6I65_02300 [Chloroflexota bacterium]